MQCSSSSFHSSAEMRILGRDADLRLLELVLARAAGGTGSVVLISGEAGIGKTRLCQELSRSHRGRGGEVLLGRAFPEEAAISLGAVADALRVARRGEPSLWQAAAARASVLWAIAPELATAREVERRSFDHWWRPDVLGSRAANPPRPHRHQLRSGPPTHTADPAGAWPEVWQEYRLEPTGDGGCRLDFHLRMHDVPKMAQHLVKIQLNHQVERSFDDLGAVVAVRPARTPG